MGRGDGMTLKKRGLHYLERKQTEGKKWVARLDDNHK